ncbi:uncharacterized protein LAESUDRAFT_765435 [Laetiporus sulphureus 93-53]|uniref:Uncharacterized protein n=1 Tax=Laetiporus sulphureus 93-53 TaxID=1314785 RepID=A0A165ARN2_9APHY|nr:uncharacterized protein LAESUDRAFT_765435 [Laetiporus sulphureus 93-53]KZS99526.1 hypothetical protein LAESUDRAFT_765435 [Laetiporus sulphureus 93-53]
MGIIITNQMPFRGDRSAPVFDPDQPRTLFRFFDDLKILFNHCQITSEADKKLRVKQYLNIDVADLVESLPEYIDPLKIYRDLKPAIQELYLDMDTEWKWEVWDMDLLIGERARLRIQTIAELENYHREFLAITSFLIDKKLHLRRLQLKQPNHYPNDPYPVNDIYEAAKFILH